MTPPPRPKLVHVVAGAAHLPQDRPSASPESMQYTILNPSLLCRVVAVAGRVETGGWGRAASWRLCTAALQLGVFSG